MNNHTGEDKPDGIMDEGLPDSCDNAVDGPHGAEYHCVNLQSPLNTPFGICRPGTTFKDCQSTHDCPDGESCSLLYVLDQTQARCVAPPKNGVGLAEACNSDPNAGPVTPCNGPLCYSFGCSELCSMDDHCATDYCVDGACVKQPGSTCEADSDCSAMYCEELQPYNNSEFSDTFCWPRECAEAGDCQDPDWFCRPFWNGASIVEDVAFAPACRQKDPGTVGYGEACGFEGDGTGLPECAWAAGCLDGICTGPCTSDESCDEGFECLLTYEWDIDVDGDEAVDTYVNVDMCRAWPHEGELIDCFDAGDEACPEGHHCQYRVKGHGQGDERVWRAEYTCRADFDVQVGFGEVCGGDSGAECASNLCLVAGGGDDEDAMCTDYCTSASDCPEIFTFAGMGWKSICLSFQVNGGETLDAVDDVYVPYCWRTSSIGSLSPCDEGKKCSSSKEFCRAMAIAGNPEEQVTVEHLCLDASQGLDDFPTKEVGEACTSWTECRGRACYPDGDGGGYCSELCTTDDDCLSPTGIEGLACTEEVLIPRPDDAMSGKTARCILAKTCVPCDVDTDCGGDMVCINVGGLGDLAQYRCGSACEEVSDCTEMDQSCTEDIGPDGWPTGKRACMPDVCPNDDTP